MMVAEPEHLPVEPAKPRTWVRVLLGLIVLAILAMWIYAFLFAPDKGVYRVDSNAWRANAGTVCTAATEQRLRLVDMTEGYIAHPTNEQMLQRADLVDKATDILEQQLNDMVAFPVDSDRDRELISAFEGFYRTLLADRRAYTARLRNFDLQPYRETLLPKGGPVTNVLIDFTSGNGIKQCAPPGELGGDTAG